MSVGVGPEAVLLAGVPAAVVVVALVGVARSLGLPSRYAPLAAVVVGVLVGLLGELAGESTLAAALVGGLVLGLSATGAHAVATKTRSDQSKRSGG